MGSPGESVARARDSFERRAWLDAYRLLAAPDPAALEVADLERLAIAAYLTGHDEQSDAAWVRAHERCLADDPRRAARAAFWLGLHLVFRGENAQGNGWLTRARSLLGEDDQDCDVRGLLYVVEGLDQLDAGDPVAAFDAFGLAIEVGERCSDRDVMALGRLGRGQSLVAQADVIRGRAYLDEAMVAVVADEVSPTVAGIVYCAVLLECRSMFDTRRAQEWTEALSAWCATQPDLVPYRGQCLVHRSEVLQFQGRWPDALAEARRACERLAGHPAIGEAYYQQAEMHRLRGEHDEAETAYRRAGDYGRDAQPGLALLRLSQGDVAAAWASIRRVADATQLPADRARVLMAFVEIGLAAGDVAAARAVADELADLAQTVGAPLLVAEARHSQGIVCLAESDARAALDAARAALAIWRELGTPYASARERVLIGSACRQLGDEDTANLELDAARAAFQGLGAVGELGALEAAATGAAGLPGGLTAREAEVLRRVAAGLSNHQIATELVVSDHTVRRHVQNIFAKIGVTSRAAATAYAFEHGLC